MSIPYDRAVACRLLSIVCCNQTYHLPICIYSESPIRGGETPLVLEQALIRERILHASKKEKKLLKTLHRLCVAASDIDKAVELFNKYDKDGSGYIDKHEFKLLMQALGIKTNDSIVDKCLFMIDADGSGMLEFDECMDFFRASARDAQKKISELIETTAMCIKDKQGKYVRYLPPPEGYMRIQLENGYARKSIFQVITGPDQINIISLANKLGDVSVMIRYALQHTKLRIKEAITFYDIMLLDSGDKFKILQYLLPRMLLPHEAVELISHVTLENAADLAYLKQTMGNAARPILGLPCGFYRLDLSKEMDRICLHRLLEISESANVYRVQQLRGVQTRGSFYDTSMHGNYSFFRNEIFNDTRTVVTPEGFVPLPSSGILEFDFAGDFRPLLNQHLNTMSDEKCTRILINMALLSIAHKDENLELLRSMRIESLPDTCSNMDKYSTTVAAMTPQYAREVQDAQTDFYTKLEGRNEFLINKRKKDDIKVEYVTESQLQRSDTATSMIVPSRMKRAKTNKKIIARAISTTMDDPFMRVEECTPSKESMMGIVEKTLLSNSSCDTLSTLDEETESVGLSSLAKVAIDVEAISSSAVTTAAAANAASNLVQRDTVCQVNKGSRRKKNPKVLKRMDSKYVAGLTRNRRKLRNLMASDGLKAGAKIKKVMTSLIEAVSHYFIQARHLANMIHCFPLAKDDVIHTFGSYKVELIVSCCG